MNLSPSTKTSLSWGEQQVLQLISRGCTVEEISAILMFSGDIIEALKQNINTKLEIHYTAEAVSKARAMNLI